MIRTWDPQIRNLVLYPTELPGLNDEPILAESRLPALSVLIRLSDRCQGI